MAWLRSSHIMMQCNKNTGYRSSCLHTEQKKNTENVKIMYNGSSHEYWRHFTWELLVYNFQ